MQATPAPTASQAGATREPLTPVPVLCAATAEALRQQVADAFAAHDPNRMAGLMLWDGYDQRDAVASIQGLAALMQHPLLGVSTEDAPQLPPTREWVPMPEHPDPLPSSTDDRDEALAPTTPPDWLTVDTTGNDGSGTDIQSRFPVVQASGCLWLRPSR